MAHRLVSTTHKIAAIVKNGLVTGNNIFAQFQPKCLELRQFLSQSKANLTSQPPKRLYNTISQKEGNKSFGMPGGRNCGNGNKEKSTGRPGMGEQTGHKEMAIAVSITMAVAGILGASRVIFNKNHEEFNWKDFLDNYLGRGIVKKMEIDVKRGSHVRNKITHLIFGKLYLYLMALLCTIGPMQLLIVLFFAVCVWAAFNQPQPHKAPK